MKRKITFITLLLVLLIPVYSANYRQDTWNTIALQGGYGEVCSVDVDILKAQAQSYMAGMPFNIKDNSVQPSSSGRGIANWSFIANSVFTIKVYAEPLKHVETGTYYKEDLDYVLIFNYQIAYDAPGTQGAVLEDQASFKVNCGNEGGDIADQSISLEFRSEHDADHFIGSADGMIFFRFENDTTRFTGPAGEYTAQVTIQIETEE